ncbi:6-carboxytetrahydropterin synthase [Glycomyces sp. NPDC046736]|uniref:6-pyruvoyl trahydropterin synthase family protein n=1 Tax=Glycomyces sp. NPDC046736 TaxID=3155615 RepID=UPI0033F58EEF
MKLIEEFYFSATHVVPRLPRWHPCAHMHGHEYVVHLELLIIREQRVPSRAARGCLDLTRFEQWVDKALNHSHLNGMTEVPIPVNIAEAIYKRWIGEIPELTAVKVHEVTAVEYRPDSRREGRL